MWLCLYKHTTFLAQFEKSTFGKGTSLVVP